MTGMTWLFILCGSAVAGGAIVTIGAGIAAVRRYPDPGHLGRNSTRYTRPAMIGTLVAAVGVIGLVLGSLGTIIAAVSAMH